MCSEKLDIYTIGIDSGSRFCGVAVYRNGEYLASELKTFEGSFSFPKFREICDYFHQVFVRYPPNIVIIEEPLAVRNGKVTRMLNLIGGGVFAIAAEYCDTVDFIHNRTVKRLMCIKTKEESVEKAREICKKTVLKDDEADAILMVESYICLVKA